MKRNGGVNMKKEQAVEILPDVEFFKGDEFFIGKEFYTGMGFFSERKLEYFLWKIREFLNWYPEMSDYDKILSEIFLFEKELDCINRKSFSTKDKKIFNTQIILSRLKALVTFEMWKHKMSGKEI